MVFARRLSLAALVLFPVLSCAPESTECVPVAEVCNNRDDDCDGEVDEDYASDTSCFRGGACAAGNVGSSCRAGVVTACKTGSAAATDSCNGVDDDCDGEVDEGFVSDTSCFRQGVCAGGNVGSSCVNGQFTACQTGSAAADDSTCDGLDDDCDGQVDEDYVADTTCFRAGACASGNVASACVSGQETACATGTGAASDATCDGVDDDCDGQADEDFARDSSCFRAGACAAGNVASACVAGQVTTCQTGAAAANDSSCDGLDNDCDGQIDEDYVADNSCFRVGACAAGNVASSCVNGEESACGTNTPAMSDASCNGVDDDCDGQIDEDYVAVTSCFRQGACAAGNVASSCSNGVVTACATGTAAATDATCDGVDDDCDGQNDEDYAVVTSCFKSGACAAGNVASSCSNGVVTACATGTAASSDVTCDGVDDDCDGQNDEDYAADTSCFKAGFCAGGNVASSCSNGVETACATGVASVGDSTCDGVDDDCDGLFDEDYVAVTSCFRPGACAAGNVASSCGNGFETACATGVPAPDDATCDGVDDDCSGQADEDYAPVTACFKGGACAAGNVASSCSGGHETACTTGVAAANDATCDGVDDDCDGQNDEDYAVVTSCFRPGACAAGNVPSSCSGGHESACATGAAAANDATCNGVDDDCDGQRDEDYVAITSCFRPGACAAGNVASSCSDGDEVACRTGTAAANDATCDGVDDDCSGQSDEDYVPVTSCFGVGACAAGNVASSCSGGTVTACKTGTPAANDSSCNNTDDDCDGLKDEDYAPVTACFKPGVCAAGNVASSCSGGVVTACKTGTAAANDSSCNNLDDDCDGPVDEDYVPVTSCFRPGACAAGNVASSCSGGVVTACATGTAAANDATCNGLDEDCSGQADEDYVADSSCFRVGVCAAGNVASKCTSGAESACQTGSPTASSDFCQGKDDDCDGTVTMGCAALTMSTVSGAGVTGGSAPSPSGTVEPILIQSRDSSGVAITVGGANFSVTLSSLPDGGSPVLVPVTDLNNGTYSAPYVISDGGSYVVTVTSNASAVQGSPFTPFFGGYSYLTGGSVTCLGCYKDLYDGSYISCSGTYADATYFCSGNGCQFTPNQGTISQAQCQAACSAESGCRFYTWYNFGACNLHFMTTCTYSSTQSPGTNIYQKVP